MIERYLPIICCFVLLSTVFNGLTAVSASETSTINEPSISPDLYKYAKSTIVKISTNNSNGSGVLIGRQANKYLVITNNHVVRDTANYQIQTADGKIYQAHLISNPINAKDDIALLQFNSSNTYHLASINSAAKPSTEQTIAIVGYENRTGKLITIQERVSQLSHHPLQGGYQIGYATEKIQKISGGGIFDIFGDLIGLTGQGISPILNANYLYQNGIKPTEKEIERIETLSWGISLNRILSQLNLEVLTTYNLPFPDNTSDIKIPKLSRKLADLETKAKQITVRIDNSKGGNGSGFIVAKDDNNYVVITASHVICERHDTNPSSFCNTSSNYKITTFDGKSYDVNSSSIRRQEGIDLATLEFSSNENYEIATLAHYEPIQNNLLFVAGYPKLRENEDSKWLFSLGYGLDKKHSSFNVIDRASFDEGYELVYTCVTYKGMSGGPVLDSEARVIGIHGLTEGIEISDPKSNDYTDVSVGYSLGIPVTIFTDDLLSKNRNKWLSSTLATTLNLTSLKLQILNIQPLVDQQLKNDFETAILETQVPKNNAKPSQWIKRGNQLWRLLRYQEAEEAFDRAIQLNRDSVHLAWYGKGVVLTDRNKKAKAEFAFKQAVAVKPNYYAALKRLSITLRQLNKFKESLAVIDKAIALKPDNPSLYNDRAGLLVKFKRYLEAEKVYTKAIELEPRSIFYYNRSLIYGNQKQWDKALLDLDRAIGLKPNYFKAYYNRGNVYYAKQKWKKALADYDRVISLINTSFDLKPEYASAYLNRGLLHKRLNQYDRALTDYNEALRINPNYLQAYLNRGALYGKQKQWHQAFADYDRAIVLDKSNAEAYTGRGLVRFKMNDKQGAIADLRQAQQLYIEQEDSVGYKKVSVFLQKL
jgi:tetratricopeptide (TPR) repeat protein/S1-C subfamily serine protease